MENQSTNQPETKSSQHVVRKHFLEYLKNDFPYGYDWVHPVTRHHWTNDQIKKTLLRLKDITSENYKVLWALWTTRETTKFLADRFSYSPSVIKKKWERAINLVMTLLYYPELDTDICLHLK